MARLGPLRPEPRLGAPLLALAHCVREHSSHEVPPAPAAEESSSGGTVDDAPPGAATGEQDAYEIRLTARSSSRTGVVTRAS